MKIKIILPFIFLGAIIFIVASCKKDTQNTAKPATVYLDLPAIPYQYNSGNPDNMVTLGRVLFYDTHLSINGAISCASCHKQQLGFSDNVALSSGYENKLTTRNALPIQDISSGGNILFGGGGDPTSLFWDGRETFLPSMVLDPMVNHVEMGMDNVNAVVARIKNLPYYTDLFNKAFDSSLNSGNNITVNSIATALAAFVGSITTTNTRFDLYNQGIGSLSGIEMQGMDLFFNKYNCNSCHQTKVAVNGYQMGGGFVNIGLDEVYADNGLGALDKNPADNGKFKIPNLRNVALSAPYMHDGRYATLNDVLEHYSSGIANHPNLDARLRDANGQPRKMNISDQEKTAIIAFLNTLTDYTTITDPKYSSPFKVKN
jgi:cytochrome c peroxidase